MKPKVLVLGPALDAISGVTTHVNLLLGSRLADDYELAHFQVGSEGRSEGRLSRWVRILASPLSLFFAILAHHAAIVHINTSLNARAYWRDLVYLAVAKLTFTRVVYQVHGGALPHKFFERSRLLTAFLRLTLRIPDLVVVLAQVELRAYRQFVPHQTVVVIPNGIDCRPFEAVPIVRSFPDQPLRLLYIGRIAREKGLYETLQGMRLATELGVDARLIIAGNGPEVPRLRRYAHALGLGSRVFISSPVFGKDKVTLLEGSDLFMLPSHAEGLPYALLESMAAGVPVIATDVGAIPDVVTDDTHGIVVPPRDAKAIANALAELSADRERISWMSRACRRRIRAAFSIDRVAAEFGEIYAALSHGAPVLAARK
jgi:glycosyltransferase involved in cell wall biosynthesis